MVDHLNAIIQFNLVPFHIRVEEVVLTVALINLYAALNTTASMQTRMVDPLGGLDPKTPVVQRAISLDTRKTEGKLPNKFSASLSSSAGTHVQTDDAIKTTPQTM